MSRAQRLLDLLQLLRGIACRGPGRRQALLAEWREREGIAGR